MTDQRDETGIPYQQDDDGGIGGQDIGNREPGSRGGEAERAQARTEEVARAVGDDDDVEPGRGRS